MQNSRYYHFKIALAIGDETFESFATKHNVSGMAVVRVLQGKSTSKRLSSIIEEFIKEKFKVFTQRLIKKAA